MSKIIKRVVMFMVAFMLCFSVPAEVPFSTTITSQAAAKINVKNNELFLKPGEKFQIKVRGVKGKVKYKIEHGKKYISVSKKGLIKAKKAGYAYVWVKTATREFYIDVRVLCKEHKFAEFVHKEPTVTECGISSYHCTVCGYRTGKKKTPKLANTSTGKELPVLSPYDVQAKLASLKSKYPEESQVGICGEFNNKLNKDLFDISNYEVHDDLSRLKPGDSIWFDWIANTHIMMVYSIESYCEIVRGEPKFVYKIRAVESNIDWDRKAHWYTKNYEIIDNKFVADGLVLSPPSYKIYSYYNPSEEYVIKVAKSELTEGQKKTLEIKNKRKKLRELAESGNLEALEELEELEWSGN